MDRGKRRAEECDVDLVGPPSGTFLPQTMPPEDELHGYQQPVIHCRCNVPACYTADESKLDSEGLGGSWGFVCGFTTGPAPSFEGARCSAQCWLEDNDMYEKYWYGPEYVSKKKEAVEKERRKKEHREANKELYAQWCATKMSTRLRKGKAVLDK